MELLGEAGGRSRPQADRPRLEHLERLQLSLRPEDGRAVRPESCGVEVEWVTLDFSR